MGDPTIRALIQDLSSLGKLAEGVVREFHRTLNTTSGVMAAGIVLSGGDLNELSLPMGLALMLFVLALVAGLLFLHLLYASIAGYRDKRLRHTVRTYEAVDKEVQDLMQELGNPGGIPLTTTTTVVRLAHIGLVAGGFALVLWSLGRTMLF